MKSIEKDNYKLERLIVRRQGYKKLSCLHPNLVQRLVILLLISRDMCRYEGQDILNSIRGALNFSTQENESFQANLDRMATGQQIGIHFKRHYGLILEGKLRNKLRKMINGNGDIRHQVSIIHWNMGAKFWSKKSHEIEAVTQQFRPDILAISEANMLHSLSDQEKLIPGYQMHIPPINPGHTMSRLVVLVRDGITVDIQHQLMHPQVAAVWLKIGIKGGKPMTVGLMYREFQHILTVQPDDSDTPARQHERWTFFINSWKKAAAKSDVIVMGDLNLDHGKWNNPEANQLRMINQVKDEIETLGFFQQIESSTRSMEGQTDSTLDHIWTNSPGRLIFTKNLSRTFSDHNLIWASYRIKEKLVDHHDFWKRERRNLDLDRYRLKMSQINWDSLYNCEDLECPLKKHQSRNNFRNWIDRDVKEMMSRRDQLKTQARTSGRVEDWNDFKIMRNKVVKKLRSSKSEFFNKLYKKAEAEKTTKSLFSLTKELQGNKNGNMPQTFLKEGKPIRKPVELANWQMDYYVKKLIDIFVALPISNRNPYRVLKMLLSSGRKWKT